MAAFPNYAILLFDGFKRVRDPGVIRSPTEGGMVKQRVRFSRVLVERPAIVHLRTLADYNNFLTWYETTIKRVDWFDWTDPVDGQVKQARIKGGLLQSEDPQRKMMDRWKIPLTLEVWGG